MNEEQNTPEETQENDQNLNNKSEGSREKGDDDYYSVDDPKRDFNTSIGDGTMRNEGLAGDGGATDENPFTSEPTDDQDEA